MIIIQTINWATDYRLDQFGIDPRSWEGLLGVLFAPLLHGSWGHLWSNLVPLVIMGVLIMLSGVRQFVAVTVLVWLVSGLGVWLIAPANTTTVGASGIVFGWLAFLIVRGIWTRTWQHIVLGLVLLALYGSLFWTGIVKVAAADITGVVTVSWQAHLFGAIGGVLAAFLVAKADGPRRPRPIARRSAADARPWPVASTGERPSPTRPSRTCRSAQPATMRRSASSTPESAA